MLGLMFCLCLTPNEIDIDKVPPQDVEYTRYLKVNNREEISVVSFVLNSISDRLRIIQPKTVNDNLIRFDLRDYNISVEAYKKLGRDIYTKDNEALQQLTKCDNPIMRADYFIIKALSQPHYNNLRNVNDLNGFRKKYYYDENVANVLAEAAVVNFGYVTTASSYLKRIPTVSGAIWEVRNKKGDKDYLLDLVSEEFDYIQTIATNPNGLLSYFVADKDGRSLNQVPPEIAIDHRMDFGKDACVKVARNCISCHVHGIMTFEDSVRGILKKDVQFLGEKKKVQKINDLFGGEIDRTVLKDRSNYEVALLLATGMKPENFNRAFVNVWQNYYKDLTLEQAAKEFDMDLESFRDYCNKSGSIYLVELVVRGKVSRAKLEQAFGKVE